MFQAINSSLVPAYIAALALGYFCGSIPFGLIITRIAGTQDIRSIGSGNIGATNVLRTGHKWLALATLLGDAFKGAAAVALVYLYYGREYDYFARELAIPAALGAFLGHLFPVWIGFKGGKGVATYIGILLAMAWPAALAFCSIWFAIAMLTRYSSVSALAASAVTPVLVWMLGQPSAAKLFALLTVLLWVMHRDNIARLLKGTEGKIGRSPAM